MRYFSIPLLLITSILNPLVCHAGLLRKKWTAISFFLITVTAISAATFMQKDVYMAASTVIVDAESKDYIETQKEIIRSRRSAYRVLKNLKLNKVEKFRKSKDPVAALLEKLQVGLMKDTRILKIRVIDQNPRLASLIANEFAKVYVDSNTAFKLKMSNEANEWLRQEVGNQKRKVAESELKLQQYKEANNLIFIEHQQNIINDALVKLNADYIDARKRRISAEAAYEDIITGDDEAIISMESPLALNIKTEYGTAKQKEEEIKSALERQKKEAGALEKKIIGYNALKREIDTNSRMLEVVLNKLEETSIAGKIETNNTRVQDIAEVPKRPIRPRKKFNIALSVILGLIGGAGLIFFRERIDAAIKDPNDIAALLQIPVLGSVPRIKVDGKNIKRKSDIDRVVEKDAHSLAAETYRSIRTNLLFSVNHSSPAKSIVITSSAPGEGKTLTAINLAMMIANSGERVLLVDADMRKPRIHTVFNEKNETGLSQFLLNKQALENVVRQSGIDNLYFVTSGRTKSKPAELISSENMKVFIEKASIQFSKIIFDTPSVGLVTDAAVLSAICTGVILIAEDRKTTKKALVNSKDLLQKADARILGVIVNNITLTAPQ